MSEILKQMQQALSLQDVFVRRAEAHTEEDFDPKHSKDRLGVQIKFANTQDIEHFQLSDDADPERKINVLRYSIETGVRFVVAETQDTNEPTVRAEITATFSADYAIKNQDLVTENGVKAFSQNVTYHIWPYWREFIHSMCARLRIPSAVLPMFQPKRSEPTKTTSDS